DIAAGLRCALNPGSFFVVRDLEPDLSGADRDFWTEVDQASSDFEYVHTDATSPAFIFYDLLNGNNAGIVHSHASIPGQLSAFEMCNDLEVDADAVFWTPHNWCSVAQLLGMVYPAWWYGCAVVAGASHDVTAFIGGNEVTHAFINRSELRVP